MKVNLTAQVRRGVILCLVAAGLAACSAGGLINPSIQATAVSADAQLAQIRSANNLPPLRSDSQLQTAAGEQARMMASSGRMTHSAMSPFARRVSSNGIEGRAAENIAHGRFSGSKVVQVWMDSAPHRRNMLNPAFTRYGLASAKDPRSDRLYWAMVLAQ